MILQSVKTSYDYKKIYNPDESHYPHYHLKQKICLNNYPFSACNSQKHNSIINLSLNKFHTIPSDSKLSISENNPEKTEKNDCKYNKTSSINYSINNNTNLHMKQLINNLLTDMHIIQPIFKISNDSMNFYENTYLSHLTIYEFLKSIKNSGLNGLKISSLIDFSIRNYLIFLNSLNFKREIFLKFPETLTYSIKGFINNLNYLLEFILSDKCYTNFEINYLLV